MPITEKLCCVFLALTQRVSNLKPSRLVTKNDYMIFTYLHPYCKHYIYHLLSKNIRFLSSYLGLLYKINLYKFY